jgi:putative peptide zinc metalloprotease protein
MAIDRPTFHEAWYRVANLRPRLSAGIKVYRQHFRGQLWYVIENTASNQYARVSKDAYAFIGLLNGKRTVSDAWRICNERVGDGAPTQGEVIQLLSQLYAYNLLYADLPPDSEALFKRSRKQKQREIQSHLMNILFVRIPLIDPDRFLDLWVHLFGLVFSWFGLLLWLGLMGMGIAYVMGNFSELVAQSSDILAPGNLVYLYLTLVCIKIIHEFSHAFACKRFGRRTQSGGEVHVMGVMFLVFFPLPYVDASSTWALRQRWQRALVGMAGVMAELALAAIAAIVWSHTSTGTVHIVAYNCIFIASVSSLLFNGNPLLRFDAYYVLADLTEIPNLGQRCRDYFNYLVKRYAWGVKKARNPAYTIGERFWFVFYGIASMAYRIFICIRILMFLNDRLPEQLFVLVPLFAFSAIVAWIFVPISKVLRYLAVSPELIRRRWRAVLSTAVVVVGLAVLVGGIRLPDYWRVEGIIEPNDLVVVYTQSDGFIVETLASGREVTMDGPVLIRAENPELTMKKRTLEAQRHRLLIQQRLAHTQEVAAAQMLEEQIQALGEQIERVNTDIASLSLHAPMSGLWISPNIEYAKGRYVRRGEQVGVISGSGGMKIRATAMQNIAALLIEQASKEVAFRLKGRADLLFKGRIVDITPAGQEKLAYRALGYAGGGSTPVKSDDDSGVAAAERIFEIHIRPHHVHDPALIAGQRIVTRVQMYPKPLAVQLWHTVRQLFQRRFHI